MLLDFWATWCEPCVEGYPHTQRLSETYANSDVVVGAVAIDDPSNRDAIEAFISAQHASFPNFIASNGGDLIQAMDEFEIHTGTLPTLKLYDQTGALHRTFGDGDPEPIRFEEIEVTIRALLARRAT